MDMVILKIRKPDGSGCTLEICKLTRLQELAEQIWTLTGLKPATHLLKVGAPPRELPLVKSPYATFADCGIQDRDTIIIQKKITLGVSKSSSSSSSSGLIQQTLSFGSSTKRTSSSSSLKSTASSSSSSKKRKISKAEEDQSEYTDGTKEKEKEKPKKKPNIVEKLMGNEVMQLKKPRNEGPSMLKEEWKKLPPISSDPGETDLDAIEAELLLHDFLIKEDPDRFASIVAE